MRLARSESAWRMPTVPLRWPAPSHRRPVVTIVALTVAIAISPVAAPPAGGFAAATASRRSLSIGTPYHVTSDGVTLFMVSSPHGPRDGENGLADDRRAGSRDRHDRAHDPLASSARAPATAGCPRARRLLRARARRPAQADPGAAVGGLQPARHQAPPGVHRQPGPEADRLRGGGPRAVRQRGAAGIHGPGADRPFRDRGHRAHDRL